MKVLALRSGAVLEYASAPEGRPFVAVRCAFGGGPLPLDDSRTFKWGWRAAPVHSNPWYISNTAVRLMRPGRVGVRRRSFAWGRLLPRGSQA